MFFSPIKWCSSTCHCTIIPNMAPWAALWAPQAAKRSATASYGTHPEEAPDKHSEISRKRHHFGTTLERLKMAEDG